MAVGLASITAGGIVISGGGGDPGTANIWVDTNGGTCTRSASLVAYADAAACGSFDAANDVCQNGDLVRVTSGSYGNQTGTGSNSRTSACTITKAAGATVSLTDLTVSSSWTTWQDLPVDIIQEGSGGGEPTINGGHDITLDNVGGRRFYIIGNSSNETFNITIRNSDFGPLVSCGGGAHIKTPTAGGDDPDPATQPHDIVLDHITLHDFSVPESCPTAHLDCLHTFYHYNLTVRRSVFHHCGMGEGSVSDDRGYGILEDSRTPGAENDLFENNVFYANGIEGFSLRGPPGENFDGVTVRYNSGSDTISCQSCTATYANVLFEGNAATSLGGACGSGVTWRYNVVAGSFGCSGTGNQASTAPGFTDAANGDFHLTGAAAARAAGNPGSCPTNDYDGDTRPIPGATTCDAGADERD
jgi:hypothetical protein